MEALEAFVDRVVGETESGHVHAGPDHGPQCGFVLACRTNGGDDLRASVHERKASDPARGDRRLRKRRRLR